ncbi:hypothetical protein AZE42_08054 [Rhizopogon vesiculosus]|uniref:Uncharacterized protein n=1 Tax=Rhizopogon vesiculosus TaxID=180088 RepID=A0A1J8QGH2_9AGAM|nr:hypothetical protein AZE42_08054 [Rhizopogon vesiculosus]
MSGDTLCAPLRGHTEGVLSVAVTQDGKHIVSGSGDKMIRIWDAATGRSLGNPLYGHTGDVRSVAILPNGTHIVSASCDGTMREWAWGEANTGELLGALIQEQHTDYVRSVAISPDGQRMASGSSDGTIRVWDLQTPNRHSRLSSNLINPFVALPTFH